MPPAAARHWSTANSETLRDAIVVIIPDADPPGQSHAQQVAASLYGIAANVKLVEMPVGKDVSDWLSLGGDAAQLAALVDAAPVWTPGAPPVQEVVAGLTHDDFEAYLPGHTYICKPTGEPWPAVSVDRYFAERDGLRASKWLDANRPVVQMTWDPGQPELIEGKVIAEGGWIARAGVRVLNLYRPPTPVPGDATLAGPWLDHVRRVYPADADHIIHYCAQRVQHPGEKLNHALVLGGAQGIGKDTILEPVIEAVGKWNVSDVSPVQMMGRFNSYVKAVITRVNEVRDLGDVNRYGFYEHSKSLICAPPNAIRCDEKNLREHMVINVTAVVFTTNAKVNGIYLPVDDRRHYVAWSDCTTEEFPTEYVTDLYGWYHDGGYGHVAAYLAALDLSAFDPKAPPPKTIAFWAIVDANRAPEDAELADAIDGLRSPDAITLSMLTSTATNSFTEWLRDRRNSRAIRHRLEAVGYVPVRNEARDDGLWVVDGKRQVIYTPAGLSLRDRLIAARGISGGSGGSGGSGFPSPAIQSPILTNQELELEVAGDSGPVPSLPRLTLRCETGF